MSHLLEQGQEIKEQEARRRRELAVKWMGMSPEQRADFQKKYNIGEELDDRAKRDAYINAFINTWQGGRTRRVKKRRATRRAKKRTRRSRS